MSAALPIIAADFSLAFKYPTLMKQIHIIKNRSDIGAGTRGADLGIDAIEVAAINAQNDYFTRFPYTDVKSHNETVYNKVNALFAKRIQHVNEQCERVADAVKVTLRGNNFPIVLSGDHSSALGTISGIKAQYPDKRLGVAWIDAHADLHAPFTTPSGNVHGMPLAAALGNDNLEYQINEVTDYTQNIWKQIKNIGIPGPKLLPEDLIFFGVRDTEPTEDQIIQQHNIRNYRVEEIRHRSWPVCFEEVQIQFANCDILYISFDVDSLDCDLISKGTGTPVSKGFDIEEVIAIIKSLFSTQKVVCLEFTEVNPLLDTKGNRMAEAAFEVLDTVTTDLLN